MSTDQNLSAFLGSVADLLRGDYKQSELRDSENVAELT